MNDPKQILRQQHIAGTLEQQRRKLDHEERMKILKEELDKHVDRDVKNHGSIFECLPPSPQVHVTVEKGSVVRFSPDVNAPTLTPSADVTSEEIRLRTRLEDKTIECTVLHNENARLKQRLNDAINAANVARDGCGELTRKIRLLEARVGELAGEVAHLEALKKR